MTNAQPCSPRRWLRFTLKSLMLLVLLACCTLGGYSLGRDAGRREAQATINQLNAECAELMDHAYISGGTAWSPPMIPGMPGAPPVTRTYDFTRPEDRAEFRKQFARPWGS